MISLNLTVNHRRMQKLRVAERKLSLPVPESVFQDLIAFRLVLHHDVDAQHACANILGRVFSSQSRRNALQTLLTPEIN
jgi:hypothetical protein